MTKKLTRKRKEKFRIRQKQHKPGTKSKETGILRSLKGKNQSSTNRKKKRCPFGIFRTLSISAYIAVKAAVKLVCSNNFSHYFCYRTKGWC
jgi:hypothetical protein